LKNLFQRIKDWFLNLNDSQKRNMVLICTGAFSIILTIAVLISIQGAGGKKPLKGPERFDIISPIPPEDFFLPDEPDFVPEVILERERRTSWSEQDAAEHWRNPLENGEEQWRDKIEAAINEYLERVP